MTTPKLVQYKVRSEPDPSSKTTRTITAVSPWEAAKEYAIILKIKHGRNNPVRLWAEDGRYSYDIVLMSTLPQVTLRSNQ
jgi:hypothetical protein